MHRHDEGYKLLDAAVDGTALLNLSMRRRASWFCLGAREALGGMFWCFKTLTVIMVLLFGGFWQILEKSMLFRFSGFKEDLGEHMC